MKHLLRLLFIISTPAYGMLSKNDFRPETLKLWNNLTSGLVAAAPQSKIDTTRGLAAIVNDMHQKTAEKVLDEQDVLKRATVIIALLNTAIATLPNEFQKLPQEAKVKLALTDRLKDHLLSKYQQELRLPTVNTEQKIISSGEQAFTDNLELMQLNSHLDADKCATEFKAFMTTYFYLHQQQSDTK